MIRFTRSQPQPIGLDIGQDAVRLLQVEVIDGAQPAESPTLSVLASAKQLFPRDIRETHDIGADVRLAAAAPMIKQMLRQHPFRGNVVVTTLPREMVAYKNLRLPLMPATEVESAIGFEAKNIFPFDTDQAHVDYLPAGEVRQGGDVRQEVIVLAAKNEEINLHLERLHRCGVVVESLDVEPVALFRSVERFIRRREDEQEVQVLVDIGSRASQMVVGRGRDISFLKTIEIGGKDLNDAVARRLSISHDEARTLRRRFTETSESSNEGPQRDPVKQAVFDATRSTIETLGREIAMCLRYYSVTFRGHRPTRVRLAGGEAGDASIRSLLEAALSIPVETSRPLFSVNTASMKPIERRTSMSEWAVAFGLSLKKTTCRFAPRDGKPRATGPVTTEGSAVELIDLEQAVGASIAPPTKPTVFAPRPLAEVAHA